MSDILGLGLQPKDLGILQVSLRGIIVFIAALVMVRLADRRFLAKMSAFDVILGFVLASMLARAINGSAPFLPTFAGGFVLVFLHRIIATISFYSDRFGVLVKGDAEILVANGVRQPAPLRHHKITEKDLLEELRLNGNLETLENVQAATLERNGMVSVVFSKKP
jgi:uncharacterized membrane protein YcaP (DUF421 family)